MPELLNKNSPLIYVVGDNARGIEMDWPTNGDLTGATVSGLLLDYMTRLPVPGWTGSVMTAGVTVANLTSPARVRWTWPQPLSPALPIGLYEFMFVADFADGRPLHSDSVIIQVVGP